MLRYKCVVRFEKSGLANRTEQKKYREIALRTAAGVCSNPCAENILSACEKNGIRGLEVNILFTDDQSIRNINREYREIDSSTDVLSFPINDFSYGTGEIHPYNVDENSFLLLLGDIVVSPSCHEAPGGRIRPFRGAGVRFSNLPWHVASVRL